MPDYYDDAEGGGDPGMTGHPPEEDGDNPAENEDENTALINKSIFPHPPEVGDTCTFRVVAVHNDEVALEYQDSRDSEAGRETEDGEGEGTGGPPVRPGSMESMMY